MEKSFKDTGISNRLDGMEDDLLWDWDQGDDVETSSDPSGNVESTSKEDCTD